ncbi:MAG TPA: aspartate aminotransferase family protein [Solirubrobacterales bacterium]|jgi:adenosylmethionine-8-amino-7-oxononanoate aminotransferase
MATASATGSRLWHPFADMAAVSGHEFNVVRGEGVWLWDDEGRRYLDATASLWYTNVGHGRAELAAAAAAQFAELDAYSIFGDFSNPPAERLAEMLSDLAPMPDSRAFLVSGGGDAIDSAAKIARRYWDVVGEPERVYLISREQAYHGTHGFGTSIAGIDDNRAGWGPLMGETVRVPAHSAEALEAEIEQLGPSRVAAFFFEPVMGAAGVLPPAPGYVEAVVEVCRRHRVLVVVDAVIAAFGRLGTWFGIERWDAEPDMIAFAKGATSGYLPLGGVMVSGRVAEPFWSEPGNPLRHGPTYAGHPVCCAVALANIELLERDGLLARAVELEGDLLAALEPLRGHPLVADVRGGVGMMAALELDSEAGASTSAVAAEARERGLLVRPLINSLAVSPPLTVGREEIAQIGEGLADALDAVAS